MVDSRKKMNTHNYTRVLMPSTWSAQGEAGGSARGRKILGQLGAIVAENKQLIGVSKKEEIEAIPKQ
jgi:hypothetical protein